jgi:hypothetical protein
MHCWFETVTDLAAQAEIVRRRRYGVIEVADGRFRQLRLRPLPKLITLTGALLWGRWFHRGRPGNRCWLYYDQPRSFPSFLALKYLVSTRHTTPATIHKALAVLDDIARLKRTDALLCDVSNARISGRMMARHGWEPHKPQSWHRNYVKRFYGVYPQPAEGPGYDFKFTLGATASSC